MFRFIPIFFIILFALVFSSCEEELIVIPKPCTEEPELSYSYVNLKLITDIESGSIITVDHKGLIYGDNLMIKRGSLQRNATVSGYICKDNRFYLEVVYNDAADNSRLRIEGGPIAGNSVPGKLYYCSNINNNCSFTQIGGINGSYSGNTGAGSFLSPLFSGEFEFSFYQ